MRRHAVPVALALGLALAACDQAPPAAPETLSPAPVPFAAARGVTKAHIEGWIAVGPTEGPAGMVPTPSGQCHFSEYPSENAFTGDLQGTVTFDRDVFNVPCSFDAEEGPLNFSGPLHGTVTYDGRTGEIRGQGWGHCGYDPSTLIHYSCGGVTNAFGVRGGELEGVRFHYRWGPGWFPFPYSGTASSH